MHEENGTALDNKKQNVHWKKFPFQTGECDVYCDIFVAEVATLLKPKDWDKLEQVKSQVLDWLKNLRPNEVLAT